MTILNPNVISEEIRQSLSGKLAFPDVLRTLGSMGVESYYADLARLEITYYGAGQVTARVAIPLPDPAPIADDFNVVAMAKAVQDAQQGRANYAQFIHQAQRAGALAYQVFLKGRKVVYTGRHGASHTEVFPAGK